MWESSWRALRRIIVANPMGVFLYAIIGKWYVLVLVATFVSIFWVVQGLKQIGFIDFFVNETKYILNLTKSAAQNCTPLLGKQNLNEFWECLGSVKPEEYNPDKEWVDESGNSRKGGTGEKTLEGDLNKAVDKLVPNLPDGPYEQGTGGQQSNHSSGNPYAEENP